MESMLASLKNAVNALTVDDLFPPHLVGQSDSRCFRRNLRMHFGDIHHNDNVLPGFVDKQYRRNPLSVIMKSPGPEFHAVDDNDEETNESRDGDLDSEHDATTTGNAEASLHNAPKSQQSCTETELHFIVHFNFGNEELISSSRIIVVVPMYLAPFMDKLVQIDSGTISASRLVDDTFFKPHAKNQENEKLSLSDAARLLTLLHKASFLSPC